MLIAGQVSRTPDRQTDTRQTPDRQVKIGLEHAPSNTVKCDSHYICIYLTLYTHLLHQIVLRAAGDFLTFREVQGSPIIIYELSKVLVSFDFVEFLVSRDQHKLVLFLCIRIGNRPNPSRDVEANDQEFFLEAVDKGRLDAFRRL